MSKKPLLWESLWRCNPEWLMSALKSAFTCPASLFIRWGAVDSAWQLTAESDLISHSERKSSAKLLDWRRPQRVLKLDSAARWSSNGRSTHRRKIYYELSGKRSLMSITDEQTHCSKFSVFEELLFPSTYSKILLWDEIQLYYELVTINISTLNLAGQIKTLNRPHMGPAALVCLRWSMLRCQIQGWSRDEGVLLHQGGDGFSLRLLLFVFKLLAAVGSQNAYSASI